MYCRYCGNEVDEGSQFCHHCGEALEPNTTSVDAKLEQEGDQQSTNGDVEGSTSPPDKRDGGDQGSPEKNTVEKDTGGLWRVGYAIGRLAQFGLAGLAVILLLGALNLNVLAFLIIAIVALVLFALVGVIELLVVRPLGK